MSRHLLAFLLPFGLSVFMSGGALAQTPAPPTTSWGTWLIGTLVLPPSDKKWGGFAEVQARSNGLFRQFFYNELKAGVNYEVDKNFSLMIAGGRYATYAYQDLSAGPLNIEKRLWEQLIINQYLSRLKFEHRYRVEQRWFNFRDDTETFRNRIRYRLNMFVPINKNTITNKTAFLSVYDEIFLNPTGPFFEQNRLYGGLGYQFDQHWILQVGWINRTLFNPATFGQGVFTPQQVVGTNNLVIGLTYRLKRQSTSEKLPSQPD